MTKKQPEFKWRDLLAVPFVALMFLFARLSIMVGSVFTAEWMLEVFGNLPKLPVKKNL